MEFINSNIKGTELISLSKEGRNLMTVIPFRGAVLAHLELSKKGNYHSILWDISDEELINNPWYKQCLLFPYPNRLEDGKYTWQNVDYQFPINEADRNNQLHGLLYDAPFTVEEMGVADDEAILKLSYQYDGSKSYFPFPFKFFISYNYQYNQVTINIHVNNMGSLPMPFGFGWHPYFKLTDSETEYSFNAPELVKYELSDRSLPTGQMMNVPGDIPLAYQNLDDVFRIITEDRKYSLTELKSENRISFECSSDFEYIQIFNPENTEAVAVEPMTCLINAFNNKEGLSVLQSKAAKSLTLQIKFT